VTVCIQGAMLSDLDSTFIIYIYIYSYSYRESVGWRNKSPEEMDSEFENMMRRRETVERFNQTNRVGGEE